MIERLVYAFYDAARDDALLGPVFASRITNWDLHLGRMCAFWSSVALKTGNYHGSPMRAHATLPLDVVHFKNWLALWARTAEAMCPPVAAQHFIEISKRIAESLLLGIAVQKGELPQAMAR
ncbi:MAG: preprotein translocase subunit TatC [Acidocella sp. 20-57-95]|nr:MAG: preprotein translocase subunit TatC [Acidocella sp. 20-57-95]OYV57911.1 MAG: preprotein translocase subunit TatC [Acidocella sp. 21-58-7]